VVILTPLKAFFYYVFGHPATISGSDVKTYSKWSLSVYREFFMTVVGGDGDD
jgi:hypothetical protein